MADVQRVYIDSCCFIDMVKTKVGRKLATDREHERSALETAILEIVGQEALRYTRGS